MKAGGKTNTVGSEFAVAREILCREKTRDPESACAKALRRTITAAIKVDDYINHGSEGKVNGTLFDGTHWFGRTYFTMAVLQLERYCSSKTSGASMQRDAQFKQCTERVVSGHENFRTIFGTVATWLDSLVPGSFLRENCGNDKSVYKTDIGLSAIGMCNRCPAGMIHDSARKACVAPPPPAPQSSK